MSQVAFRKERFIDVIAEAKPLLMAHWQEIARYKDIPLAVDEASYQALDEAGKLRVYTARNAAGKLVGYAAFIVGQNLHYCTSGPQAKQDVLFVHPDYRGTGRVGLLLIDCIDQALAAEGVQVVYHHEKVSHPALGRVLRHLEYENVERIWAKRLDQGKG